MQGNEGKKNRYRKMFVLGDDSSLRQVEENSPRGSSLQHRKQDHYAAGNEQNPRQDALTKFSNNTQCLGPQ